MVLDENAVITDIRQALIPELAQRGYKQLVSSGREGTTYDYRIDYSKDYLTPVHYILLHPKTFSEEPLKQTGVLHYPFGETDKNARTIALAVKTNNTTAFLDHQMEITPYGNFYDVKAIVNPLSTIGENLANEMVIIQTRRTPEGDLLIDSANPRLLDSPDPEGKPFVRFPLAYEVNDEDEGYGDYFVYLPRSKSTNPAGTLIQLPRVPFMPTEGGTGNLNSAAIIVYPISQNGDLSVFKTTAMRGKTIIYGVDQLEENLILEELRKNKSA